MSKKKKSKKHRNFNHAKAGSKHTAQNNSQVAVSASTPEVKAEITQPVSSTKAKSAATLNTNYVTKDLKTIGILALSAVVLELLLWFILQNTAFGAKILAG